MLIGSAIATGVAQSSRIPGVNNMNHVAIAVENFDEAFKFYTEKMGFRDGFTVKNAQGQPTLLDVERVVQVHGGVEPFAAVLRAAGQ